MKGTTWGPRIKAWLEARSNAPLRMIWGPQHAALFWMLHGDYYIGEEGCPTGLKQAIGDVRKVYTSIRLAAVGVSDTFVVIWEDDTMVFNLKNQFPGLEAILQHVEAGDISVSRSILSDYNCADSAQARCPERVESWALLHLH